MESVRTSVEEGSRTSVQGSPQRTSAEGSQRTSAEGDQRTSAEESQPRTSTEGSTPPTFITISDTASSDSIRLARRRLSPPESTPSTQETLSSMGQRLDDLSSKIDHLTHLFTGALVHAYQQQQDPPPLPIWY